MIATAAGVEVSARLLETFVQTPAPQIVPPTLKTTFESNRLEALRYLGVIFELARMAEEEGLAREGALKDSLEMFEAGIRKEAAERSSQDYKKAAEIQIRLGRAITLATALMRERNQAIEVTEAEMRQYWEEHTDEFTEAKVKVLYLPFRGPGSTDNSLPSEGEASATIRSIQAQVKAGADFVELLKQHSKHAQSLEKDGAGTLRKAQRMPAEARAVFDLKPGEISGPVRWAGGSPGYYLFRLEEVVHKPFEEVKAQTMTAIKDQHHARWLKGIRDSIQVQVLHKGYFEQRPRAVREPVPPGTPTVRTEP